MLDQSVYHKDVYWHTAKATINEILVSGHPPAYVLQFCVKSLLCIATIYKAPRLLIEHNNKLCNVLAFVIYTSCNNG